MAGKGIHTFSVQESQNLGLGQGGSVYTTASSDAIKPPTGRVFVAITMLDDSTFAASTGLLAETSTQYINTGEAANDAAAQTATTGEGGLVIANSVTFPKGITIYGRWTEIDVNTGSIMAYIG